LTDDHERILELRFKEGYLLKESLISYKINNIWLLPLLEFAESIGVNIRSTNTISMVEGYILHPSHIFRLNVKTCEVEYKNQHEQYDCNRVIAFKEEIFVDRSLLEIWFPVLIEINSLKSQIYITALEKLPPLARLGRERMVVQSSFQKEVSSPDFIYKHEPYSLWDGVFIDQHLLLNRFAHDTTFSGEVLGMETLASFNGDIKTIKNSWLSFARRQPDGGLLGFLNAKEIQLWHFNGPSLPLVGGANMVRGGLISNYPLNIPTTFGGHDFEGELLPNWDMQLYHNDILIGQQSGNVSGRYHFKNVPLLYGDNRFRLVLFGPRGEEKVIHKTFQVDSSLIQSNTGNFRLAAGIGQQSNGIAALNYQKNLFSNMSMALAFSQMRLPQESFDRRYYVAELNGFLNHLLYSSHVALNEKKGQAYGVDVRSPLSIFTIGANYRYLSHFRSDVFNRTGAILLNQKLTGLLSFPIDISPQLSTRWEFQRKYFNDEHLETEALNYLSTNIGPFSVCHKLDVFFSAPIIWTGDLSTRFYLFFNNQASLGLTYGKSLLQAYDVGLKREIANQYNAQISLKQQVTNDMTTVVLSVNKYFKYFTAGLNFSNSNHNTHGVGISLSYSFFRDPRNNNWAMERDNQADHGAISALVFQDKNHNFKKDPDEKPMPDIKVIVKQSNESQKTNREGMAYFRKLMPQQVLDMKVSPQSFENIFHKSMINGFRIYPRMGKTTQIDFPIWTVGEVGGNVVLKKGNVFESIRNVELELLNAQRQKVAANKTDEEGIYTFEGLKPGHYTLQISSSYLKTHHYVQPIPLKHTFIISENGDLLENLNFSLIKK